MRAVSVGAVLMVALTLLPLAAAAADAETTLQEGIVALRVGKFRESLKHLDRALGQATAARADRTLLGRVQKQRGIVLAVVKRMDEAEQAFIEALKHDPLVVLERGEAKSSIMSLFEGVRQRSGGRLEVTADRPGAEVRINGRPRGLTPYAGKVAVGRHRVMLTLGGRYRYEATVVMQVAGKLKVTGKLEVVSGAPAARGKKPPAAHGRADSGWRLPVWTLVTGGVALAALGVGLGMGASASSAYDEWETTTDPARFDELKDTVHQRETLANVMFGVAGGLAVAAVVVYFLVDRPAARADRKEAAVRLRPGPLGVDLTVRF